MKKATLYKEMNLLSYAEYGDKDDYPILIQHGLIASITDWGLFERFLALRK